MFISRLCVDAIYYIYTGEDLKWDSPQSHFIPVNIYTIEDLNRRRIKTAQRAVFSSRFMTDNQLTRHTSCAILNVHRFKTIREASKIREATLLPTTVRFNSSMARYR